MNKSEIQFLSQIRDIYKQKIIDLVTNTIGENKRDHRLETIVYTIEQLILNKINNIHDKQILADIFYLLDTKLNTDYQTEYKYLLETK